MIASSGFKCMIDFLLIGIPHKFRIRAREYAYYKNFGTIPAMPDQGTSFKFFYCAESPKCVAELC